MSITCDHLKFYQPVKTATGGRTQNLYSSLLAERPRSPVGTHTYLVLPLFVANPHIAGHNETPVFAAGHAWCTVTTNTQQSKNQACFVCTCTSWPVGTFWIRFRTTCIGQAHWQITYNCKRVPCLLESQGKVGLRYRSNLECCYWHGPV